MLRRVYSAFDGTLLASGPPPVPFGGSSMQARRGRVQGMPCDVPDLENHGDDLMVRHYIKHHLMVRHYI